MSVQEKVREQIKAIPARQWVEYSQRFGKPTQDVMEDAVLAMVVVANEQHRQKFGSPSLEKYLDMGLLDLVAELENVLGEEMSDAEAESGEAIFPVGDEGAVVAGGVAADVGRGDLRADEGPDLPSDGGPAE